jgi:hypothetical protein
LNYGRIVRNTSGKTYTAHVRFNWRSATATGKTDPIDLVLQPNATEVVDVAAMQAQNLLPADAHWATVTLSAPVQPNELVAVAASYDKTGRYGAQTPFNDQLASHWEGGMWEVDSAHNSLLAIGNGGSKTLQAELTILYNQGSQQYQILQTLAPDEQMLVDLGKLIREQIPDKSGHTLPTDLTSGAYRIRDMTDIAAGTVYEGKVIVDKTNGHAAYGCAICCGPKAPIMAINPLPDPVGGFANQQVQAPNSCGGGIQTITGDFPTWWTDNTAVATANGNRINGIAVGTTNHHALSKLMYWGPLEYADPCPQDQQQGDAGTCVGGLKFSGTANAFVFVGSDSHIVSANSYFLSGTPTGGTYGATSSDSSDTLTPTFVSSLQLEKVTVQTADQSTTNGDRTLTFSYTPPSCPRFTLTQTVTARKFSYLTNNNPSNQCTLGFGTTRFTSTQSTHIRTKLPSMLTAVSEGRLLLKRSTKRRRV